MKPRSVFPRAVALVSLLVAALCVGCGSDGPLDPGAGPDVIGILEKVDLRSARSSDAYLLIGELVVPDREVDPSCEPCRKVVLILPGGGVPIFVLEPNRPMRQGGLNDMAIGDTIWGWHTGVCLASLPSQCYATRIVVVKPESDL